VDALRVRDAEKVEEVRRFLERVVARWQPTAGPLVVPSAPQWQPPTVPDGALLLHLTARYLDPGKRGELPYTATEMGLGVTGGSWKALPAEEWLVFEAADWQQALMPQSRIEAGTTWIVDPQFTSRLLQHFYPQTPNTDVARNFFISKNLQATVVSVTGDVARIRLEGHLFMRHAFARNDDDNTVRATLEGYADLDLAHRRVVKFGLVTDRATWGGDPGQPYATPVPIGVAVRSGP
jgi:hypothetical protein